MVVLSAVRSSSNPLPVRADLSAFQRIRDGDVFPVRAVAAHNPLPRRRRNTFDQDGCAAALRRCHRFVRLASSAARAATKLDSSETLSWSSWELKLRVLGARPSCLATSMTLPGRQRRPSLREPETYVTRGGGAASSTPTLRAFLDFDIRSTTSSTQNISQSARCEFFRRQAPTISR